MTRLRVAVGGLLIALTCAMGTVSRADTVASLLGNFTINQYCGVRLAKEAVDVHYVVVFGQLPALRELHAADTNGDGVTSQEERDAYVGALAPDFGKQLALKIDDEWVPLRAARWSSSLPTEQGGFSLRVDVDFTAPLRLADGATHRVEFQNKNYPGRIGWHEISVQADPGLHVFDTDGYSTSLTGGLANALQSLPASGPLDERAVHFDFVNGDAPAGAVLLTARPQSSVPDQAAPKTSGESTWIAGETRRLVDSISGPQVELRIVMLALLGALVLGAVHALSPGHGKTIVGAYLVGSRGTPRHAAFLAMTVTVTHTLGVFLLGFATLYASRFIVPERLFPILSLVSALLVLAMGVILMVQRSFAARQALSSWRGSSTTAFFPARAGIASTHSIYAATHPRVDGTLHSHGGGPLHSHLPPGAAGEKITWRNLMALGISGGLVPCPSAMVLLLAAVALNKTAFGMLLVLSFSLGLAITLSAVGMAFLYARNRFRKPSAGARWPHLVPVLSAGTITLVGIGLCVAAVRSF